MIKEHETDVHSNPTGNYKIGFSASPYTRIRDLRGGNPRSLVFQHTTAVKSPEDSKKAEKEMHTALDKYRIKNRAEAGTEWFFVDGNHFHDFEETYIRIANKYKAESLNYLDEVSFKLYSLEEARKANEMDFQE